MSFFESKKLMDIRTFWAPLSYEDFFPPYVSTHLSCQLYSHKFPPLALLEQKHKWNTHAQSLKLKKNILYWKKESVEREGGRRLWSSKTTAHLFLFLRNTIVFLYCPIKTKNQASYLLHLSPPLTTSTQSPSNPITTMNKPIQNL